MEEPRVEVFDATLCTLGEGPAWDPDSQTLYWIDIDNLKIFAVKPSTKERWEWLCQAMPGSFALWEGRANTLLVADKIGFREFDTASGRWTTLVERLSLESDKPHSRFNDGKCDAYGRFWAGTMDTDPGIRYKGSLYCLHDDLHVTMHRRPVSISNGLAWTSDNKTLYYIDSPEKAMIAWDFDLSKGTLSNERIAFTIDLPNEKFDGQTIDAEGMLWVAIWGGGCVRRYNPKTGEVLGEVNLPCPNITSCCFGGPNFETLYVTTADYGSRSAHPQAGQTFAVTGLGVRGLRFFKFKLSPSK